MSGVINESTLIEVQNWRYAVKKFDAAKKIPQKTWDALEESLILSPTSFGIQLWKFVIVTSDEVKSKLKEVSWNQSQVTDCSHHVVFLAKKNAVEQDVEDFIDSMIEIRGGDASALLGYKKMMIGDFVNGPRNKIVAEWLAKQTYIALGNFMTSAALLGVDTCPMEGLDAKAYDKILGIENSDYQTIMACPAGYRSSEDKYQFAKKVRYSKERLIVRK